MGFGVSEEFEFKRTELIQNFLENKISVNNHLKDYDQNLFDEKSLKKLTDINKYFDEILDFMKSSEPFDFSFMSFSTKTIFDNRDAITYDNKKNPINFLTIISYNLLVLGRLKENEIDRLELLKYNKKINNELASLEKKKNDLEKTLNEIYIIKDDLKNKKVNDIFEDDSKRFKKIARIYEFLFYLVVLIAGLYFLGLTFYIVGFDYSYLSIGFPEKIHGNISAEFYIQKISFLVLSTTLAAFLLKRSFMNRRLADEAYRTAKELDALPRYMEGMPNEMKEKIRFDLAYKYFGNGIHHDSYTSGENLMHENIKANTEFMKIVKGVPSTTDESKTDKDKNE